MGVDRLSPRAGGLPGDDGDGTPVHKAQVLQLSFWISFQKKYGLKVAEVWTSHRIPSHRLVQEQVGHVRRLTVIPFFRL